jgi:hypothetical protein
MAGIAPGRSRRGLARMLVDDPDMMRFLEGLFSSDDD